MDILVVTDADSILIDKYWIDIIVTQTKKYFTKEELELEDIEELYYRYDDYYMYLELYKRLIGEEAFNIFYQHSLQAYNDYPNTDDAKAHWIDFRGSTWRERNALKDYLDISLIQKLLEKGKKEGYFDGSERKKIDFQDFVSAVLRWWKAFLDFLKENYGKPTVE